MPSEIQSSRYKNSSVNRLVQHLQAQRKDNQSTQLKKIRRDRKVHQSCCQMIQLDKQREIPQFNNKTQKQGGKLFEQKQRLVPYMFIPGYKKDNFILPDRAFAKGNAAKRFFIKMKDTTVYSFKQKQDDKTSSYLRKDQKQKTIIGRQLQQLQRIIDANDGRIKARDNKWLAKMKKTFKPTGNFSELFSQVDPFLEPRTQVLQTKKKALTRTYSKDVKWRPSTRSGINGYSMAASMANTYYSCVDNNNVRNTFDFSSKQTAR